MFDATPPQDTTEQAVLKKLRPEMDIVAPLPDTTKAKRDTIHFYDALKSIKERVTINPEISISARETVNPSLYIEFESPYFTISNWTDAGFTGDFNERSDISKIYSETFFEPLGKMVIHPISQYDAMSHGDNTLRAGVASTQLPIGKRGKIRTVYCPVSNKKNDEGKMEKEVIIWGNVEITSGISAYGMLRNFSYKNDDGTTLGFVGVKLFNPKKNYYFKVEYRDFPKECGRERMPFWTFGLTF